MITIKNIGFLSNDKQHLSYSSLSTFQRCPRAYYWKKEQEIILSKPNNPLINGLAYHHAKAAYHSSKMQGQSHETAMKLALENLAAEMLDKVVESDDLKYSAPVAVETMSNYFEMWKDEAWKTKEVEVNFGIDLHEFVFVGVIDRIVESPISGGLAVEETKTTSIVGERWSQRLKPNLQLDSYIAAMFIILGVPSGQAILDVIPLHVDAKKRKLPFRYITTRSVEDVDYWIKDVCEWWKLIQSCKDTKQWPRNTESCCPLVGFSCEYATLCNLFPNPTAQSSIELPAEYQRKVLDDTILVNGGD